MKSSTQDKAEAMFHKIKGKVKEDVGKISDNPKLEAEGTVEKMTGQIQEKVGEVKKVWGNSNTNQLSNINRVI
ncbi:MAG: CsbD family protein [Smithella sp.]